MEKSLMMMVIERNFPLLFHQWVLMTSEEDEEEGPKKKSLLHFYFYLSF